MPTREEMLAEGRTCYCLNCKTAYRTPPIEPHETGHGAMALPMCECGCDLFAKLTDDTPIAY